MEFIYHCISPGIAVVAVVIRLSRIDFAHEIIFRISCRRRHDCLGVDIILPSFQEIFVIIRSVDIELDANILKGRLGVFGKKGEFLTGRISQPAQRQEKHL